MSNSISDRASDRQVHMSNGNTDVLLSVLLLAGSDLAETDGEVELMVWLAEHDQGVRGRGAVGFDLAELPAGEAERAFLLRVIDLAATRHRWDVLGYEPPFAQRFLAELRELVRGFEPATAPPAKTPYPEHRKCPGHDVYLHEYGCLLCHDAPIS